MPAAAAQCCSIDTTRYGPFARWECTPHADSRPAARRKSRTLLAVALGVALVLGEPVVGVTREPRPVGWARLPQATVHEHDHPGSGDDDVGTELHVINVEPQILSEDEAGSVEAVLRATSGFVSRLQLPRQRIFDPAGPEPPISFQRVSEAKAENDRLHLDLHPTGRNDRLCWTTGQRSSRNALPSCSASGQADGTRQGTLCVPPPLRSPRTGDLAPRLQAPRRRTGRPQSLS